MTNCSDSFEDCGSCNSCKKCKECKKSYKDDSERYVIDEICKFCLKCDSCNKTANEMGPPYFRGNLCVACAICIKCKKTSTENNNRPPVHEEMCVYCFKNRCVVCYWPLLKDSTGLCSRCIVKPPTFCANCRKRCNKEDSDVCNNCYFKNLSSSKFENLLEK